MATDHKTAEMRLETTAIGRRVLPALEKLSQKTPGLVVSSLCSADGFNLCSIGLDPTQVYKMAAVSSTLFAVSVSVLTEVRKEAVTLEAFDMLSLTSGSLQIIGVRVPFIKNRHLVLLVATENTPIGAVMAATRSTAAEITDLLKTAHFIAH